MKQTNFGAAELRFEALIQDTKDAVDSGSSCVEVRKLPEGNFIRTFLLSMHDGH